MALALTIYRTEAVTSLNLTYMILGAFPSILIFTNYLVSAIFHDIELASTSNAIFIVLSAIYVFLAIRNAGDCTIIGCSLLFCSALVLIMVQLRFGEVSRDSMTGMITDFSFYRICFIGYVGGLASAFLTESARERILLFLLSHSMLFWALFIDNKSAMVCLPVGIFVTISLLMAFGKMRVAVLVALSFSAIYAVAFLNNTDSKVDRWISVINPNILTAESLKQSSAPEATEEDVVNIEEQPRPSDTRARVEPSDTSDFGPEPLVSYDDPYVKIYDTSGRLRLWKHAIKDSLSSVIFGHGPNEFRVMVRGYYEKEGHLYTHPHNLPLDILHSFGLVGLFIFFASIYFLAITYIRLAVSCLCRSESNISASAIFFGGSIGTLVASFFNGDLYDARFIWIFGALAVASTSLTNEGFRDFLRIGHVSPH